MGSVNFKSKNIWSGEIIAITMGTIALIVIVLIFSLSGKPLIVQWLLSSMIVLPLLGCVAFIPIYISIEDGNVKMKKIIGSIVIPIADISAVRVIDKSTVSGLSDRKVGSGGFCGYLGRFKNEKLGNYTMYVTNRVDLVKIRTDKKTYVFNCQEPEKFIEVIDRIKK